MARDRANIRTDMWASRDWRRLSTGAQWLYMFLLTSPTLTYAGISDWRPARIAAKVDGVDVAEIRRRAAELEAGRFAYADDKTEEIVIRSFLRHDGLLLNPNLWRSIGTDFADIASERLQQVVAVEAKRLRSENPNGFATSKGGTVNPWVSKYLATLLGTPTETPSGTPSDTLPVTPSSEVAGRGCPTTTATATATSSKEDIYPPPDKPKKRMGQIYSTAFEEFWLLGLRKESKGQAWKAWEKARKSGTLPDMEALREAVRNYLKHNPDVSFQKHPATWLNAGAWEDDYTPTSAPARQKEILR